VLENGQWLGKAFWDCCIGGCALPPQMKGISRRGTQSRVRPETGPLPITGIVNRMKRCIAFQLVPLISARTRCANQRQNGRTPGRHTFLRERTAVPIQYQFL